MRPMDKRDKVSIIWFRMKSILTAKFQIPEFAIILEKTDNAFLLYHCTAVCHYDTLFWSDSGKSGENRLGLLLMIVRDEARSKNKRCWLPIINRLVDANTGKFYTKQTRDIWLDFIAIARTEVKHVISSTPVVKARICAYSNCDRHCNENYRFCCKEHHFASKPINPRIRPVRNQS